MTQTTVGLIAAASGCASLDKFMTEFSLAVESGHLPRSMGLLYDGNRWFQRHEGGAHFG